MTVLSSRPTLSPNVVTVDKAVRPAMNILAWLVKMIKFPDDSPMTIKAAGGVIVDALDCLMLDDFIVAPIPGTVNQLHYEVAIKPLPTSHYVVAYVRFDIQP